MIIRDPNSLRFVPLVVGTALLTLTLTPGAGAQEEESTEAESAERSQVSEIIVVTAQKREQSLIEVPISIGVISGDLLQQENRNEVSELQYVVPSLTFADSNTTRGAGNNIRGVGTVSFSDGLEGSVGVVVDGVVLGRQGMGLQDLADVERIEVLRGPQGTLFGKNASAGLISIVTAAPPDSFRGGLGLGYASENEIKVNALIGGPLGGDQTFGRLSGYFNQRDGLIEDIGQNLDYNGRDEYGLRGRLLFDLSTSTTLTFSADWSERDNPCCMWTTRSTNGGFIPPLSAPVQASPENTQVNLSGDVFGQQDVGGVVVNLDHVFSNVTLSSITAYRVWDEADNNDADQTPANIFDVNLGDTSQDQFTQELRFAANSGSVDWVAGAFYFDQKLETLTLAEGTLGAPLPPGVVFGNRVDRGVDTLNYALFADATWALNDRWSLFGGLRALHEEIDFVFLRRDLDGKLSFPGRAPIELADSIDDDAVTWRGGALLAFGDRSNGYAQISRGYKGAGFNALNNISKIGIIEPEIPTSYEIGYKTRSQRNRVTVNTALFHTEFEDFQAQSFNTNVTPAAFELTNAGKLETEGVEIDFTLQAATRVSVSGNASYVDATFTDFPGASCYALQTAAQGCNPSTNSQDLAGKPLPNSPELTFNLAAQYFVSLGDLPAEGFVRGSYHWRDNVIFGLDQDPNTRQDSYGIFNLSVGATSKQGRYEVSLFAKNLFDEFFVASIFDLPFNAGGYAQFPTINGQRLVGISFRLNAF